MFILLVEIVLKVQYDGPGALCLGRAFLAKGWLRRVSCRSGRRPVGEDGHVCVSFHVLASHCVASILNRVKHWSFTPKETLQ